MKKRQFGLALIVAAGLTASFCRAEERPALVNQDNFYIGISLPLDFAYGPALNGDWAGGFGMTLGYERPILPRFSLYLEGFLTTMDLNENLAAEADPNQVPCVFGGGQLGVKFLPWTGQLMVPYFATGLGLADVKIQDMTQFDGPADQVEKVPGLTNVLHSMWTFRAGLDIPAAKDLTTFLELDFLILYQKELWGNSNDVGMTAFASGLRFPI